MTTRENGSAEEPVIRDNRKIDPETGKARTTAKEPEQQATADEAGGDATKAQSSAKATPEESAAAEATSNDKAEAAADQPSTADRALSGAAADLLAERTADLQRLQAEYANYRKRVERDRITVREQAVASVLSELLPVLDDIGRARDHGELTGGFAKVSESLEAAVGKLGLTTYGAKGDVFDPMVHEALIHSYSSDVTEPTCVEILQPGYRIGERIIRPARVAVAEPDGEESGADGAEPSADDESAAADTDN